MKELGLTRSYRHQNTIRNFIKDLMALPNLPPDHILGTFDQLKVRCPMSEATVALRKLVNYFEVNWIGSNKTPPQAWSTYKRAVRTNNDVEGWHNRLNDALPCAHPNMYLLIEELATETSYLPIQIRLVAQQNLMRRVTKKAADKQDALIKIWDDYEADLISASALLRACGKLTDHDESG